MDARFLHAYARILLRVGVNLQQGQNIRIIGEPIHRDFMLILAEEAYRAGGRFVKLQYNDMRHALIRAECQEERHLEYVPGFTIPELQSYLDEDWALLHVDGAEDPDMLAGADKARLATMQRARSLVSQFFTLQVMANRLTWCVAPMPTLKWAEKVLGAGGPGGGDRVEELWKILIPTLRLDQEDPVAAWGKHARMLGGRADALNAMGIDRLHFVGPGTDFTIGLMPRSKFIGGSAKSQKGIGFIPNLPTEEVFTTPDFRRASGKVACTRPVEVLGAPVDGVSFEFADGSVTGFTARKGREALEKFLDMDPHARQLGEVALVDLDSPVNRAGVIFHSILFDENAACHMALGNGYPDAIVDGEKLNEDELRKLGCNISLVHTDFMISSPEVSLFGLAANGDRREIMRKGKLLV
jgi:aminopeptidase